MRRTTLLWALVAPAVSGAVYLAIRRRSESRQQALRRTLAVVGFSATGYLLLRRYGPRRLSSFVEPFSEGETADLDLPFMDVRLESTDGLVLAAKWAPKKNSPRAAVLVPGRGGSKRSRYVLETAPIYARAGFNVLMLSLRSQGDSEGKFLTAGYQEVHDVRGALSWLEEQGFDPGEVVLHGWSTGAVTVVRAAPGTGVAAVVEESGYAYLPLLLGNRLLGKSGPSYLLSHVTSLIARALNVDFDPWVLRPTEEAERLSEEGVPLFVIHSRGDRVVPFEHARMMAVYPGATLWEVEGRDHAAAYTHPEYAERLLAFLDGAMGVPHKGRLHQS